MACRVITPLTHNASWVHSHAPSIWSHRGTSVVCPDFQLMRVSEEPVSIYLFRQNPVFTSLHLRSPVDVVLPLGGCMVYMYNFLLDYWVQITQTDTVQCTQLPPALQRKCYLCLPRKGIARPQSKYSPSCVCGRFIYFQDRSTYFPAAEKADRNIWIWKSGLRPCNSFSGNICFKFSVWCLCSELYEYITVTWGLGIFLE